MTPESRFSWRTSLGAGVAALGRLNRPAGLLLGVSWAGPLLLILLASMVRGGVAAYPRHLVFLEPFAAILLVATGIVTLLTAFAAARKGLLALLVCLLVAAFGYPAVAQTNPAYQLYRYDLAADFVKARYMPSDAVVYYPAGTDLAFRHYFSPPGEQIAVWGDRTRWSRSALQPAIRQTTDRVAQRGFARVWLVYSSPWPRGSLADLVRALGERGYRRDAPEDFHDLWVMLFTRPGASAPR